MRIAYLTSDLDTSNGWGRYSAGFLAQARVRNGSKDVNVPDPERLHAKSPGWHRRFMYPFMAALVAWKLREEVKGVDIIHAATEPVLPHAYFLSIFLGLPYVVTAHGTYGDIRTYGPTIRWFYRLAFRRASRVIAVSGYTAEVVRLGLPRAKIAILPGGFDPRGNIRPGREKSGARQILAVGAVKRRKGFHTLLEVLGLLKDAGFDFRADCVGPRDASDYVAQLEARLVELGLEDRLVFHGRVSEEELDRFYADADLFVLPSEHNGTAFEGLGLVYLEAMSRGVPSIGCSESGAEDVIVDGINGRLVPPGNPEMLADAVQSVLNDDDAWKRMSAAAPESIARFRWEKVGGDMDALYATVVEKD